MALVYKLEKYKYMMELVQIIGGFYKLALERFETICEQIYFQGRRDVAGYVPRTWKKRCRKEAKANKDNS